MKKAKKRIFAFLAPFAVFLIPLQVFAAEEGETMRQKLGFAAQNTVVGIVTVFCMLLLMAGVIYLFRFLPKLIGLFQRKDRSEKEQAKTEAKEEENVQAEEIPPVVEQEAASAGPDDTELVAVITAAVAAAREQEEPIPIGSFVVRTIKKRA